jgi:hypothetical protein
MRRLIFCLGLFALLSSPCFSAEPQTTIHVDASVILGDFKPAFVFGANTFPYVGKQPHFDIQPQVEAAGQVFFRYPDGYAEYYHWNSKGRKDEQGRWVPDQENYAPGFKAGLTHRGTTSSYGDPSCVTDGDPHTAWVSNADTAFPHAQWLYLDLKSPQTADAVSILWGKPYATRFTVQYWKPGANEAWAAYLNATDQWVDTTAAKVKGKGGTQTVSFAPVTSRYFRILMSESSAQPPVYSVAELYLLKGGQDLTRHAATNSNANSSGADPDQTWVVASTTDSACYMTEIPGLDFESFMAFAKSFQHPVSPLVTVNMAGTPQEAAAWVHYANKVKGYSVKYWELGNEMNGHWEAGGPWSAKEYAHQFVRFAEAMKAEDPSIVICGPAVSNADVPSNDFDGKTFIQGFVDELASVGKTSYIGAIDFHWYPAFMNDHRDATWASVRTMANLSVDMDQWLSKLPNRSTVPILLSEFNTGALRPFSTDLENGLWLADTFGEFLKTFASREKMGSYWCLLGPSDAAANLKGGDQAYIQLEENAYRYQPRATYWAMQLLSSVWAVGEDQADHCLVQAESGLDTLSVYADHRPDGVLSLLIVNRDREKACEAALDLKGFKPAKTGRCWTYDAKCYKWDTTSLPYHANPNLPPVVTTLKVKTGFRHSFPPTSITVLQFVSEGRELPEPPAVPTPLSATRTAAPWDATATTLDDFEDATREGPSPARLNLWGGGWESYWDKQSSVTFSYGAPGANGTARSAHFCGKVTEGGWACFQSRLAGGWPPPIANLQAGRATGVQFWILGDGKPYRVMVQTKGITDYDYYGSTVTPSAGQWTRLKVYFKDMRRSGWGKQSPAPPEKDDMSDATGFQVSTQDYGAFDMRLDDVAFFNEP